MFDHFVGLELTELNQGNWCKNDITSHEVSIIDVVTSNYGLYQLIQEPAHIRNSSSSCIDLVFTPQPNLVMESGVHLYIQIVIIRWSLQNLIYLFCIHHRTKKLFGSIKKQPLNLSEELLMNLIG